MTFEDHLDRWSVLHGGLDPRRSALLMAWLRLVHVLGLRLRVPPDALTVLAVVAAVGVVLVPGRFPWVAALLVLLSALLDGLDGSVAVLQDRVTRRGAALDAVGDRICDLLFVLALVLAGAPWWLGIACAAGILLLEGSRVVTRRVGACAGTGIVTVTVTVAERPTRVFSTAFGLVSVPLVGLVVLAATTVVGLVQLAVASDRPHRSLR